MVVLGQGSMKRYGAPKGAGLSLTESDNGQWCKYSDVETLIAAAASIAARHDIYKATLIKIAGVPLTIPNAREAVNEARRVLEWRES